MVLANCSSFFYCCTGARAVLEELRAPSGTVVVQDAFHVYQRLLKALPSKSHPDYDDAVKCLKSIFLRLHRIDKRFLSGDEFRGALDDFVGRFKYQQRVTGVVAIQALLSRAAGSQSLSFPPTAIVPVVCCDCSACTECRVLYERAQLVLSLLACADESPQQQPEAILQLSLRCFGSPEQVEKDHIAKLVESLSGSIAGVATSFLVCYTTQLSVALLGAPAQPVEVFVVSISAGVWEALTTAGRAFNCLPKWVQSFNPATRAGIATPSVCTVAASQKKAAVVDALMNNYTCANDFLKDSAGGTLVLEEWHRHLNHCIPNVPECPDVRIMETYKSARRFNVRKDEVCVSSRVCCLCGVAHFLFACIF